MRLSIRLRTFPYPVLNPQSSRVSSQKTLPYSARSNTANRATIVRPANLRGLAPDHTLVLINNKRRHRAAVIFWLGNGVADGAQGPDISAIPSIAIKQVEILRDGAAAQYGSDAIAGVMNFMLKNSNNGGSLEARYGRYYEGDGKGYSFAGQCRRSPRQRGICELEF